MKYFHKYIQNVEINFYNHILNKNDTKFIVSHCGTNIKKISLSFDLNSHYILTLEGKEYPALKRHCMNRKYLNESFWQQISGIVKNVEVLDHEDFDITNLKYFPRLKKLSVQNFLNGQRCIDLEVFQYNEPFRRWSNRDVYDLSNFLNINREIKVFRFMSHFHECLGESNKPFLEEVIKIVAKSKYLKEFELCFRHRHFDCSALQEAFEMLNVRENRSMRLNVHFTYAAIRTTNIAAMIPSFTGVCFPPSNITAFANVKILHQPFYFEFEDCFCETLATQLAQQLPNLEEFYFERKTVRVEDYIIPFVRHSSKLRILMIPNTKIIDDKQHISLLASKRKMLSNAVKLTIYLESKKNVAIDLPSNNFVDIQKIKSVQIIDTVKDPSIRQSSFLDGVMKWFDYTVV